MGFDINWLNCLMKVIRVKSVMVMVVIKTLSSPVAVQDLDPIHKERKCFFRGVLSEFSTSVIYVHVP